MPILSTRFDDALQFAADLHRPQTRKGTDIPYVGHLLSVAGLVLENDGTEVQAIAALLHDAIEDQATDFGGAAALGDEIEKLFGGRVRAIVEACTDSWQSPKPEWRVRKEHYVAHIADMAVDAMLVSLSDKVHNARSIVADLHRIGPTVFERFTGGRDGALWYYRALAESFRRRVPSWFLAGELLRIVTDMERLASSTALAPDQGP